MTIKYTLIIEGTEKEITKHRNYTYKLVKEYELADYFECFDDVEYKVVEPLYFEFYTEIDECGRLSMTRERQDLLATLAQNKSKKIKVVITEEE